jgi:hypothetical protein
MSVKHFLHQFRLKYKINIMPYISSKEFCERKNDIEVARIGAISLDTSIYEKNKFCFNQGSLARMRQFSDNTVRHVIVDVTKHEFIAHIKQQTEDAVKSFKKSLRLLTNSWVIGDNPKQLMQFLTIQSTPDEVFEEYSNYTGLTILYSSDYVPLQKLIEIYFNKYPPFSEKKKDEFHDAIVLLTLEAWAEKENTGHL